MKRKIYKKGDMLSAFFSPLITFGAIGFFGRNDLHSKFNIDTDIGWYIFLAVGTILGIIGVVNTYIIVDTEENVISYPFLIFFRKKIILNDIESYETDSKTTFNDDGKSTTIYYLLLFGPFGSKKISFKSASDVKTIIHTLNSAAQQG